MNTASCAAKKTAAAALVVALLAFPARSAGAWDEVCVHLPLWRTAFAAHFHVVHGFDAREPGLPAAVWEIRRGALGRTYGRNVIPSIRDNLHNRRELLNNEKTAARHIQSGSILANQTRCVSVSALPEGEPFFVLLDVHGKAGRRYVYCEIHERTARRHPWYHQMSRPYRKMVYHAWGGVGHPRCEYNNEEN